MALSGEKNEPGAGVISHAASDMLSKLARNTPYYRRNLPHICSFWVKGECKRGEECPFRHEKPTDPDDPLADQNLKDRYYGVNDPVAAKLMQRAHAMPSSAPPDDRTITTLYVGNLGDDDEIGEQDLRDFFYQFGEIRSVHIAAGRGCAFIQYTTRDAAERAADRGAARAVVKGKKLNVRWGRPQSNQGPNTPFGSEPVPKFNPVPGLPGQLPLPNDFFGLGESTESSGVAESEPPEKRPRPDGEGTSSSAETEPADPGPSTSAAAEKNEEPSAIPAPPGVAPTPLLVPPPRWRPPVGQNFVPLPPPPLFLRPPTGFPPMGPPGPRPPRSAAPPGQPRTGVYYPSQDPQRLGTKETST